MRKLKVGDRVLIKRNVNRTAYIDISYPDSMTYFMGKITVVDQVRPRSWHPHGYIYYMLNSWCYVEEWITPLEELTIDDLIDNNIIL